MIEQQEEIKQWFDQTYKERGFGYLRPLSAYEIFATLLSPLKGKIHLDVACGLGLLLKTFDQHGAKVHGVDISTEAIQKAKVFCPNATINEANAETLPYEDGFFDSVTCIGSLERMLDREKVISEQARVTKPDGKLCFMVRNAENFTWNYFQKPLGLENKKGHQDALNLEAWSALFNSCGLQVEGIYPDHWPYYRLLKTITPWRNIDTTKIRKFPGKMKLAYEFIFVLSKHG